MMPLSMKNFDYLAEFFPPTHPTSCPKCQHRTYVFGSPSENPKKEILACTFCGFLFHYPCPHCGKDTTLPESRTPSGLTFRCMECHTLYEKPPGWLERPSHYQDKLSNFHNQHKSQKDRARAALL